ncbi:hypothetical protein HHK36_011254 [Tetracentron sinense]|uniref:Glabrous enhancer-binding protein-like DBD domain-containing protein n=1 Tax=Tetracentron sinense TaxID=13715 RepID=A0A835DJQ4_TETSI|nr:hypothetical protein HHK36_011254 [Tetracentron sinense]
MSTPVKVSNSSKRKKRASGEKHREISVGQPENPSSDNRKRRFQRVFSEEDEIHLLNVFLDISKTAKTSSSPVAAATPLFDRIGKSLSGEFSHTQLIEKLRKMRQKYSKQINNELFIKSPHERDVFEISHKIWSEDSVQQRNSNSSVKDQSAATVKKKDKSKTLPGTSVAGNGEEIVVSESGIVEEKEKSKTLAGTSEGGNGEELLVVELALEKFSIFKEEMSWLPCNAVLREGLQCLDEAKLSRLNEQWRFQQIAEAEVLAKRVELIQEQTKLFLGAIVSSSRN